MFAQMWLILDEKQRFAHLWDVCTFHVKIEPLHIWRRHVCTLAVDVFLQICTFEGAVFATKCGCLHIWGQNVCTNLVVCTFVVSAHFTALQGAIRTLWSLNTKPLETSPPPPPHTHTHTNLVFQPQLLEEKKKKKPKYFQMREGVHVTVGLFIPCGVFSIPSYWECLHSLIVNMCIFFVCVCVCVCVCVFVFCCYCLSCAYFWSIIHCTHSFQMELS